MNRTLNIDRISISREEEKECGTRVRKDNGWEIGYFMSNERNLSNKTQSILTRKKTSAKSQYAVSGGQLKLPVTIFPPDRRYIITILWDTYKTLKKDFRTALSRSIPQLYIRASFFTRLFTVNSVGSCVHHLGSLI